MVLLTGVTRRGIAVALPLVATFSSFGLPTMAADERTHVVITGPREDWHPRPRLLLEIGDKEWVIIGSKGVRAVTDLPTTVVIRDLADCRAIFSFTARQRGPSDGYRVTVDSGRRFQVEPTTGFTEGPFALPSPGDRCPDLPDTSTATAGNQTLADALAMVLHWILAPFSRLF